MENSPEEAALNRETQDIWNQNAVFWDDYMGEGGQFQQLLIGPPTERLLGLKPGERVLDIACGNGAFSRRMAQIGADVVACDFSAKFIECARARATKQADRIVYLVLDATDESQLIALGKQTFDASVCTMAMMDMVTIEPMLRALVQLLKSSGRFVFSVAHPCFNSSPGTTKVIEEEDRRGEVTTTYALKISSYSQPTDYRGLGIVGQPVPQIYFHRPLNTLLGSCFRAGFVLDALEEPVFDQGGEPSRPFGWARFKEFPPVLIARLRFAH